MPSKMWFGNEQRFQWVPMPSTGMEVSNVGYFEQLSYENGRAGIVRSMQTHKEYEMEFPLQEASGLEGVDVFNKFAMGFYNDLDSYPLFFADQMNYDQNLFPPNFAAPGLYRRGWASIVCDDSKVHYNHATNPSVEVNDTNYATVAGTSGTAAGVRTLTTSVSGEYSYRATWTVATSAVSGGTDYLNTSVIEGFPYDFSVWVTCSKIQRVQMTLRWRNVSDTSISTVAGTQTVLAATTPTKLEITNATPPVGAVTADLEIRAVSGTSGSNWAAGNWLQLDAVMINWSHQATTLYFDGSTPGAGWQGTAHASTSVMYVPRPVPTLSNTPANSYNLPPVQATWDVMTGANAYPTIDNEFGEIPYALIPIPPGYVLHMGATGSATGTARVAVDLFNAPGDPATPALATSLTLLSPTGATRLNASFSGASYQYAKVYIERTSTAVSTITLSSMMAQLWPIGYTPNLNGNFIEGKGHRGLKFADSATVESYVIVDRNRNVPIHYKGMSTRLVEAQDKG